MRQCGDCRYFDDDPIRFEQALPGILALSSGQGDTKGDQGLCARHDRMVAPQLTCPEHVGRTGPSHRDGRR